MESDAFFDALADVPNLRSAQFDDLEIKDGGNVFLFDGLAAVYGQTTDFNGRGDFTEEVRSGAFDEVLASGANVPLLHEHDPREMLATTRSGRLKLTSDTRGLRARAKLVKTDLSSRIKALVESGDITGMSTGWVVGRGNHKVAFTGEKPHRVIHNLKRLIDVSTTWDPAYGTTEAQFRSMAMQYVNDPASWQRLLMGAFPQLGETGHDSDGGDEDEIETRSTDREQEGEAGVAEQQTLSVAARRRALELLLLETRGVEP
jgi:HK97 family phage prohead protease